MRLPILYLFNPESDLALANFSATYTPPPLAIRFGHDAELLPLWFAEDCSLIAIEREASASYARWLKSVFGISADTINLSKPYSIELNSIKPWGWNPLICRKLSNRGISGHLLPNIDELRLIRDYSNRKHAVSLLAEMRRLSDIYCGSSTIITDTDHLQQFLSIHSADVVLKMPNSGSGKGLMWIRGGITDKQMDWSRRVLKTQNILIAESVVEKVLDCAMEFRIEQGKCQFVGYSLFESSASGAYIGNKLMSDTHIQQLLSTYIPEEVWQSTKSFLTHRLAQQFPSYEGYLGVDMMVCHTGNTYKLHPMVEINVRMNMGLVARFFYDNYVSSACQEGIFRMAYFKQEGEAYQFDKTQQTQHPFVIKHNRLASGYLSLNAVDEHTRYVVYVVV